MTASGATRGFSLLELLVVVFIIGVLATMMTLSVGTTGGDRELEREVDRIEALIDLALDDAVVRGREIGLRFYPHRYEFSIETWETTEAEEREKTVAKWSVITDDDLLKPRLLSNDLRIELRLEGRAVALKAWDEDDASRESALDPGESAYRPQVFLLSSGDVTPFTLRIRRQFSNTGITLRVESDGSVERDVGDA